MSARESIVGLIGWGLVVFAAAWSGAQFSANGGWYASLRKPAWAPPAWLFAPGWTLLYIAMSAAAWLVWKEYGLTGAPFSLGLFAAGLAFSAAWPRIFFGMRRLRAAFNAIMALWTTLFATMLLFRWVQPEAGWLLAPCFAWVTFMAALNDTIARANPDAEPQPDEAAGTEPGETEPGETEPGETEPGETEPGATEAGRAEPGTTDDSGGIRA